MSELDAQTAAPSLADHWNADNTTWRDVAAWFPDGVAAFGGATDLGVSAAASNREVASDDALQSAETADAPAFSDEVRALLDAVSRAIAALDQRSRAIVQGRVAPPRPAQVEVAEAAPEITQEAAPPASVSAPRHDTVVMDADAIRALVQSRASESAERQAPQLEQEPAWDESLEAPPVPPPPPTEPEPEVAAEPSELVYTPTWSREVELLYDDALFLFQNDDLDGALISLERLLVLAPMSEEIQQFVALNEAKLVSIYERVIGPWSKVLYRRPGRLMPPAYTRDPKLAKALALVNGDRAMSDMFGQLAMSRLEVCSVLSQLLRSRLLTTEALES